MKHELGLINLLKKCFTLNIKQIDYIYPKLSHMYHYSFIPPQKGKRWTHKEEWRGGKKGRKGNYK